MPKITYVPKRFNDKTQRLIDQVNEIIDEFAGYELTLRTIYYQLVGRGYIPNKQSEYKKLSRVVSDARLAGLIDWDSIGDIRRELRRNSHWDSPASAMSAILQQYQIDKWEGQEYRPEVWIEKDALLGVIAATCRRLDVPYFACVGYNSQSEMWRAGHERFDNYSYMGQVPYIIHLGDHDPSGLDMTRDTIERLELFTGQNHGSGFVVNRIALNFDQVEQYNPPPNPAKLSDPRLGGYVRKHGRSSWELDALDPITINNLIEQEILSVRDESKWAAAVARETKERQVLKSLYDSLD